MLNKHFFDDISQQLAKLLPAATELSDDLKKSISSLLESSFAKLNLLTREEFDAQAQVLRQARDKIHALEQQMEKLEIRLGKLKENSARVS